MSLPTASCANAFCAWQASCSQRCSGCLDSTSCTCSIHGILSQHKKGKGGGGKKVCADESASKSRLINSESRQVLVGDLQPRAWWTVCASAHKRSKKYLRHLLRLFPGSVRQCAIHPLSTSCSAWPMFVMLKIHLWFPWVAFYTGGQKHEQLNIQQTENSCSRETGESREDILQTGFIDLQKWWKGEALTKH